jgi:hypothetical protein
MFIMDEKWIVVDDFFVLSIKMGEFHWLNERCIDDE